MTGNSMPRRTFLSVALGSAAAAAVTACGFSGDDEPTSAGQTVVASGSAPAGSSAPAAGGGTLRQMMPPVPHLDPAIVGSTSARGNLIQSGLLEGLTLRDPDDSSKVLPGVAEKWTVSDDGLTYTFMLRSDAKWSNGDPVTAKDFLWNWERLLSPETSKSGEYATAAAGDVLLVVGAADFAGGSSTDFSSVGVKATDDKTVVFTLTTPSPLFLQMLAEWRALPLHPATVKAHPKDWATSANWVGNGPFVLTEWRPNAGCTLSRSKTYWDTASYPLDKWQISFNDGGDTAATVSYTADEIDLFMVEGDPAAIISDPDLAKQLQTGPASQFKCLVTLTSKNPLLEDIRIRKALSLAIDRSAIANVATPDAAGGSLVPNGIAGYDKVPQTAFDPDQATQLLADAGYPGGKGLPTINLLVSQPTPWLEAVGGMWQEHLGVKSAIDLVEVGVFGKRRVAVQDANYVGFCYGYFGLTPPSMYKSVLWGVQNVVSFSLPGAAAAKYQALLADKDMKPADRKTQIAQILKDSQYPEYKKYADLVTQASAASNDPAKLEELSLAAAIAREESYIVLPVLWSGYSFLVKPAVHGIKITSFPDRVFAAKGVSVQ